MVLGQMYPAGPTSRIGGFACSFAGNDHAMTQTTPGPNDPRPGDPEVPPTNPDTEGNPVTPPNPMENPPGR